MLVENRNLTAIEKKDAQLEYALQSIEYYTSAKRRIDEDNNLTIIKEAIKFWTAVKTRIEKEKKKLEKALDPVGIRVHEAEMAENSSISPGF